MIKIANIALRDCGYASLDVYTGDKFTQVTSGAEIELKGISVAATIAANMDDSIIPDNTDSSGYFQGTEINQVSVASDTYTIKGTVSRKVTADMTQLSYLRLLCKSKGIKLFYYTSTTDGYRDLTDTWGAVNTDYSAANSTWSSNNNYTPGTTPVIFVRCRRLNVTQGANSTLLNYTLELIETTG